MAQITAATGVGTASSASRMEDAPADFTPAGADFVGLTGPLRGVWGGAGMSGCVFVILTGAADAAAGCGKILIRAVSFFGPACACEPG